MFLWGGHPTPEDITDDGNGTVTNSLEGKSEVRAVLVQNIDDRVMCMKADC